jgi:adenine specific DNA methylase Mod
MNHLFYGDNLAVLRESIADESVDLIYLDPPFNSNASYNVLFRGRMCQEVWTLGGLLRPEADRVSACG